MVLESLFSEKNIEKHPIFLFFMAFLVTSIGLFVSAKTFPESSSVLTIAFVAIAFMPIMHALFLKEEKQEITEKDMPFSFISTHFNVIHIYSWIFIGMIFAFSFWVVVLPETSDSCEGITCLFPLKSEAFSEQTKVHYQLTGKVTGGKECFASETKNFGSCFELIFLNNFWVMILAIIFSFIWGAGAIFLLGWNASVIGIFIGLEITSKSMESGLVRAISYLPHGIPEILAYFIAAIAGGIISTTISKKKFLPHELRIVFIDTVLLLLLATITLFIGAFIETAAIFNYMEIAMAGIIAFAILYFILYIPSVRYKIRKIRNKK